MNLKFKWLPPGILVIALLKFGTISSMMIEDEEEFSLLKIDSPASHVALSGDFAVSIANTNQTLNETKYKHEFKEDNSNYSFVLRVLYILEDISELIGGIALEKLPSENETLRIVIPCNFFSRGGLYILRIDYKHENVTTLRAYPRQISKMLNVKWPLPVILLESQQITTYPDKPVATTIRYDDAKCVPLDNVPVAAYVLQLIYCGSSTAVCYMQNSTYMQILYYEEMRDFQLSRMILLRCELFGLPGNYALRMKSSDDNNPTAPNTSIYFKVNWSEEFKLTVHAKSIYPCEGPGGVAVLFQYPSCRLDGDRIRVYGRLKADVTSVASPSSLHYIAESRSIPGKHSLAFDCDLFTEKFVEYCFVYVSQAVTGAMADVKMACVPTFPFQEGDTAGWGPWSPWSPCSSSCFGGVRNRYRFCDKPPPKYGAQFCQGKAIETELCGKIFWQESNKDEWHNRIESSKCRDTLLPATKPEIVAEIGLQCRCGCRVVLKEQSFRKILGANTQACPGRSFWLLQAPKNFKIGLHLNQLQFPCPGQYFRVRDGNSLNADLLVDVASDKITHTTKSLFSSGQNLLLEFFSDELTASGDACIGGFLAHTAVLDTRYLKRNETITIVPFDTTSTENENDWIIWQPAHLATTVLLIIMFIVSVLLTLQFFIKYRKYHIPEDMDNFSDISELMPGRSKFLSTSTIISEVISMIEMATKNPSNEALNNIEDHCNSSETLTGFNDGSTLSSSTIKLKNTLEISSDETVTSVKSNCDKLLSASSILVYNKPEVKYAYPVKLQTLDYSSQEKGTLKMDSKKLDSTQKDSTSVIYQNNDIKDLPEVVQDPSPESIVSSSSTLGSGKETKERRNREKLLQGPGSEFSLTNPDSELELDYYDYNVANASAVPGSYLGMDPAFLVWIPPIDDIRLDADDLMLGTKRNSILALETEGTALTPSEYRRMKLSSFEDFGFELERTRTYEKLLPVKKLLEDSSIKVSMESVSSALEHKQHCTIPNRRVIIGKEEESSEESNSSKSLLGSPISMLNNEDNNSEKLSSGSNKNLQRSFSKLKQNYKHSNKLTKTPGEDVNVSCTYKDLIVCTQPFTNIKDAVNIPMTELAGSPLKDFAQVRKLNSKDVDATLNMQNPDYGIEAFCVRQGSLYDQKIKFVDDDDEDESIE